MTGLVFRFATVTGQRIDWRLARSGSWTAGRIGRAWLLLCLVVLCNAVLFGMLGARQALALAALEVLAAAAAYAAHGRHAADGERISLQGSRLVVERETAGRLERAEFDRSRVRVEPKTGDRSLIMLTAQGQAMEVGRYLRPELRSALASEIRMALRTA